MSKESRLAPSSAARGASSPAAAPNTALPQSRPAPAFRTDINGLRAWAVLAVILYHFHVGGFSGGFVGVDIFFVISGFLMTGIIVGGAEPAAFSLLSFYLARARRIVPPLLVLCAVLLSLGWLFLLPVDYKTLGASAVYSLSFLSNMKFWQDAGYFDAESHEKWLLHTWSLSVEWQFYLILPLIVMAVWRLNRGRGAVALTLACLLLASLGLSVALTADRPSTAFYLLPSRAWEMLAGGMVYLAQGRFTLSARQRTVLESLGLAAILGAVVWLDAASSWPGSLALIPVLGTMVVVAAARPSSPWTGGGLVQWFGTRSYSLYLWHWPIVVALVFLDRQRQMPAIVLGLALTLLLGEASYRWIERPSQRWLVARSKLGATLAILAGVAAVAAFGSAIRMQGGMAGRFSPASELLSVGTLNKNPRLEECGSASGASSPSCIWGGKRIDAVLIGDSHGSATVSGLAAAIADPKQGGVMEWTYSGCPTLFGVQFVGAAGASRRCGNFLDWVALRVAAVPKDVPLVIVNRTTHYAIGYNEPWEKDANSNVPRVYFSTVYPQATEAYRAEFARHLIDSACSLAKEHTVYLVRPIPEMGVNVPKQSRRMLWDKSAGGVSISLADYHRRHDFVWAAQDAAQARCAVRILDPLPYLCRDGRCHGIKDGQALYYDDDHLSEYGNKQLVPMFRRVFAGN
ncbi:acyltransferase family protein [Rugamonas sp. CCM 8940]|uniref:acyltransferase family protein n=1 Tax=Rugamonas sp. CCM 8940 TaxID=2765359 RepID=UPI0018F61708|nr:acyltransferase family protein [Rugamonas sp. CCM 8940]MBJ7308734.1 acyltransferase [Rugamonas sp. CCM 8940]